MREIFLMPCFTNAILLERVDCLTNNAMSTYSDMFIEIPAGAPKSLPEFKHSTS